jgi:hypothetical protein
MSQQPDTVPAERPIRSVEDDIACIRCDYNLRTLRLDAVCPECGSPVGLTVRDDLLRYADPQWVQQLASGSRWILLSTGLAAIVALPVAAAILMSNGGPQRMGEFLLTAGSLLAMLIVPGCLRLTAAEPGRQSGRLQAFTRWSARYGMIFLSCTGFVVSRGFLPGTANPSLALVQSSGHDVRFAWAVQKSLGTSGAFLSVQWMDYLIRILGWLAMLTYVRHLAMRLPDRHLAHQTKACMWCLIASMALLTWVRSRPLAMGSAAAAMILSESGAAVAAMAITAIWLVLLLLKYRRRLDEAVALAYAWSSRQPSPYGREVDP